ncbi:MAG: penicillin-binding transpeptidase domain-containing protein [Pseudomonadales bacterium]|nr:penicillin-binding protein 2 [Pseudomonadales bacterium]
MNAWRHTAVVVLFVGACIGLATRVGYLTVSERDFLQHQGDARSVRTEKISAYRGVIYDRYGEPLAVSTPVAAVWTDPSLGGIKDGDVTKVARALKVKAPGLKSDLERNRSRAFMYIKRGVPLDEAERLRELDVEGVYFQPEYRRFYPAGETAAHVVGLTGIDDEGLEGIELSFNETLRGEPGRKVVLKDQRGTIIKDLEFLAAPRFGQDLTLTLDLRLQFIAYRELKAAVESHRAASGSLVMLDVETGGILALVNQPSFNPNQSGGRSSRAMRNRAVTDTYEPGSTIKPFTALAAMESGRFERYSRIDTAPGYFRVGSKLIQDPLNRGTITLETALKKSSQVGFTKIALALEPRAVYEMLTRIGLGEYQNTRLPGAVAGTLTDRDLDKPVVRATLAYGYGLAVSPLQLAQAYLTLAGHGVRLPVSIIREAQPPAGERVFDARLGAEVVSMLEGVAAADGTAPDARIPGYRVAGKTGTVRKVGAQGYDDERHVAWFAGIAPASDPRIVMVVLINEPAGKAKGGGEVAAPVFGRVMARAMRLLGIPPDEPVTTLARAA